MQPGRDFSSCDGSSCDRFGNGRRSSGKFVQGRVIDLFVCCGGKDMLALDWIPFISGFLHYSLSAKAKVLHSEALSRGLKTFDESAVVVAAAGLAKELQGSSQRVGAQQPYTFEAERLDTALALEKAFERGIKSVLPASDVDSPSACRKGCPFKPAAHEKCSKGDVVKETDTTVKGSRDLTRDIREFKVSVIFFVRSVAASHLYMLLSHSSAAVDKIGNAFCLRLGTRSNLQ